METGAFSEPRRRPPVPRSVATGPDVGGLEIEAASGPPLPLKRPADSTVGFLFGLIKRNVGNLPGILKANGIWVGGLAAIWFFLGSLSDWKIYQMPAPLRSLVNLVIFVTGTYGTAAGKAAIMLSTNSLVLPLLKESKANGLLPTLKSQVSRLSRAVSTVKRAYSELQSAGIRVLLVSGGAGFALANAMSRNNKVGKYMASAMLAVTLLNALSRGIGDPWVRFVRAIWHDARGIFGKDKAPLGVGPVYAAVAGIAAGLAGSIIFHVVRVSNGWFDFTGYIVGGVCLFAGIAWSFAGGRDGKATAK